MADIELTFTTTPYDRVSPLITGEVKPQGITLRFIKMTAPDNFYQQLKFNRFDVSEMSFSSYLIGRANGWPYRMLPVFHNRGFFYTTLLVRKASGIRGPQDLKGKRIGTAEYQQSAALWSRGILQHEFGIRPEDMEWYQERTPRFSHSGATAFEPPPGLKFNYATKDLASMLVHDELDVALIQRGAGIDRPKGEVWKSPKVRTLFSDPKRESIRYFKKNGIIPAQHITVVRESILEEHPWVATSLYEAFEEAQRLVMERLYEYHGFISYLGGPPSMLLFSRHDLEKQRQVFGDNPYAYGLKANANLVDMVQTYSVEQGLTKKKQPLDELIPQEILLAEERLS
jgi:4,5-dihydroxyphthalate decarboxylase